MKWLLSLGAAAVGLGGLGLAWFEEPAVKPAAGQRHPSLAEPVRLRAGDKFIDTEVGHAAPFVGDFDGDGVNDLLVGQFGEGILWLYKNVGTNTDPKLAPGVKFKEGKKEGTVPTA